MPGHDGETIGDRFHRKLDEERLEEAFASADASAPLSIGLIEAAATRAPAVPAHLVTSLAHSIARGLPPGARVIDTHGARFMIALPGLPLLEALLAVDRVRDALERERWTSDGAAIELHFSAGVASRRSTDESALDTLAAAERSLGQARHLPVRRHESTAASEAHDAPVDAWPTPRPARGPEPTTDA